MWQYEAPLRDMRYVIEDVLGLPAQWASLPAFADLDADTARQVLDEAARFATEVLAPTNPIVDLEGCTLSNGEVRTPRGFVVGECIGEFARPGERRRKRQRIHQRHVHALTQLRAHCMRGVTQQHGAPT